MPEQREVIKNDFERAVNVYDRKYLNFFAKDLNDHYSLNVFNALKTGDIGVIEGTLKELSNTVNNFTLLIGLACVIIEKERLYEGSEFGVSYLRYADHLFENLNIPASTLSDSKIIVEQYLLHHKQLIKAGFKLRGNSSKLRYLSEALENHQEDEVFRRIVNDTHRSFVAWAQRKNIARASKPEPEMRVNAEIKGDKLFIDGKNILNFPKGLPVYMREMIMGDLVKTMSIREGGNTPYIIDTYDKGEQTAINNFLKQYRAKK
jgi:hypothetical protein